MSGKIMTQARQNVIQAAISEAMTWVGIVKQHCTDDDFYFIENALFKRLEDLQSVVLSAVEEDDISTEALAAVVNCATAPG